MQRPRFRLFESLALEGQDAAMRMTKIRRAALRWERMAIGLLRSDIAIEHVD